MSKAKARCSKSTLEPFKYRDLPAVGGQSLWLTQSKLVKESEAEQVKPRKIEPKQGYSYLPTEFGREDGTGRAKVPDHEPGGYRFRS